MAHAMDDLDMPMTESVGAAHPPVEGPVLSTVSLALVQDLLESLQAICSETQMDACLKQAGIVKAFLGHPGARLTHDQLVRLYKESAASTGDEMMGLWSRPIRTGTLKYLIRVMLEAPSIRVALYRFTQFWNLLLDDYRLHLDQGEGVMRLELIPRSASSRVNRFGHTLMLKLTHGILSWLVGREVSVQQVAFSFARPAFADDYPILFPAPVAFQARCSAITFGAELGAIRGERSSSDMRTFLERAPRDWIFTVYREHAVQLKVRELLYADLGRTLEDVSQKLHVSSRTLIRRLQAEDLSFQGIKDGLRRDLAIRDLVGTEVALGEIAYALGFSSPAVFHRAFRQWTGMTPGSYRAAQQKIRSDLASGDASTNCPP